MRFLVDNALSPVLVTLLTQAGHDALHTFEPSRVLVRALPINISPIDQE